MIEVHRVPFDGCRHLCLETKEFKQRLHNGRNRNSLLRKRTLLSVEAGQRAGEGPGFKGPGPTIHDPLWVIYATLPFSHICMLCTFLAQESSLTCEPAVEGLPVVMDILSVNFHLLLLRSCLQKHGCSSITISDPIFGSKSLPRPLCLEMG